MFKLEKMEKKEQKSSRSYKIECASKVHIILNFKKQGCKNKGDKKHERI